MPDLHRSEPPGEQPEVALWSISVELLQQALCLRQIGIEFQDPQDIIASTIDLPSITKDQSDVYPNAALSGGALECILPEADGFAQMSTAGFDYAQIRCRFDHCGIDGKRLLIELAGAIDVSFLLCGISQGREQRGIV